MCLAIPARILEVVECNAKVDVMGVESQVNIQLIESPRTGDYILIHAGCAIQKIETDYFNYLQEVFQAMLKSRKEYE